MAKITTITQMRDYIKMRLGAPIINIEVSNNQLDLIIEDSAQDFNRLNYSEASFRDYAFFTTSAGVSDYVMSGQDICDVYDLSISMPADGINTMFSPTHLLLYEQFQSQGTGVLGTSKGMGDSGLVLASYDIAMMYLKEIKTHFGKMYSVIWLPNREVLKIVPTPTEAAIGVLCLYRKEVEANLYNHPFMKKITVARTKILWGNILGKYSVTLPDGMGLNGERLISEGKEEEAIILEEMRSTSAPIDFFVG